MLFKKNRESLRVKYMAILFSLEYILLISFQYDLL